MQLERLIKFYILFNNIFNPGSLELIHIKSRSYKFYNFPVNFYIISDYYSDLIKCTSVYILKKCTHNHMMMKTDLVLQVSNLEQGSHRLENT